jgi:hypothetical protein
MLSHRMREREMESRRSALNLEHKEKRLGIPGSDAVVESSHGEILKYREGGADAPQPHETDWPIVVENDQVVRIGERESPTRHWTGHCEPRLRIIRSVESA